MKEYIERDALKKAIEKEVGGIPCSAEFYYGVSMVCSVIMDAPTADVVEREAISGIMRESMTDAIKEFATNFDRRLYLVQAEYTRKGETEKAQAFEEVHELLMKAVEEV